MGLLDSVSEFLRGRTAPLEKDKRGAPADLELQAATAVLLIEAAYGNTEYAWREHHAIVRGLEQEFGLGRNEIRELLGRADEIRPPMVKLKDVTDVLRERFGPAQREEVLRLVWRVVTADGEVEEWEQSFVEHVARALSVSADAARGERAGPAAG